MKPDYTQLAKIIPYADLCMIEDALKAFNPRSSTEAEKITELLNTIISARGWAHHVARTDQK